MATYNDIFVRDNFNDAGVVPSEGTACTSPDIIPYQADQLTWDQISGTYLNGPDLGKNIINGQLNNIFVRAKNLQATGTETGTVSLYYSSSSLLLLPDQWLNNRITTASGQPATSFTNHSHSSDLNPNDIAISNSAFVLNSLPNLPPGNHYCFIAIVDTPNNQVTVPESFDSNAAFVKWVQNTPAVGWRNLTFIPSRQPQIYQTQNFGNDDPTAEYFYFRIVGTNMPVGTLINVQCTHQTCPFNVTQPLPAPDPQGNQITGFNQLVPANFHGAVTLTATPPAGSSFNPGAQLSISYYQVPPTNMEDLHREVGRFYNIVHQLPSGDLMPHTAFLIKIGECTLIVKDAST